MSCGQMLYLHYGAQCPGYIYMGQQAEGMALELGRSCRCIDVEAEPEYALEHGMFFPGMIVIDDLRMVYPGTVEQMLESYRLRGPIPGDANTELGSPGDVEQIEALTPEMSMEAARVCLGGVVSHSGPRDKLRWLKRLAPGLTDGVSGYLGIVDGRPVGGVEFVRETDIPYPIPRRREDWIFITCLYSTPASGNNFRPAMLEALLDRAVHLGYRGVSAVAGLETPYPNGPWPTFADAGFETVDENLGRALLRHRWERMVMVDRGLDADHG